VRQSISQLLQVSINMVYINTHDLDIDSLVDAFQPATKTGRAALLEVLSEPISDLEELTRRQTEVRAIKSVCKTNQDEINVLRTVLKDTEEDVVSVAEASKDERLKEYYTQILWLQTSMAAKLNEWGWLNELIVFLRTVFIPGISVLLPVFIFVAPLVLFTFVLKQPITMEKYIQMIQSAVKKAMPSILGAPRFAGKGGIAEMGEQFLHIGVGVAMLGASIWNQVSSAMHMRKIVADMRLRATSVQKMTTAVRRLASVLNVACEIPEWQTQNPLGIFGYAWNDPSCVVRILEEAGRLDMLCAVAMQKRTCFPKLDAESIVVRDLYHPGLDSDKRVYNSIEMSAGAKQHVLLTGPNRGGKSTLLKSLGYAVLMGQTVGVVFGRKASLPLFSSIITALYPMDTLGKMSLFEAEIEFAKSVRARIGDGKMFLMMDEIFHGTNAHDGVEASQIFLDQLYKSDASVFSIVSTHYMDLPTKYGDSATQNLCMDAKVDPADEDRLIYSYKMIPGTNKHSSVREILRERGLLRSEAGKNTDVSE
jgi:energy-coupling factor transporter ATP-binding protein EcfA2